MNLELFYSIWLAHLAAYQSRRQNLEAFFESELFGERLARYRTKGV